MRGLEEREEMWAYTDARVRGGLAPSEPCGTCAAEGGRAGLNAARESAAPRVRSGLAYAAGFAGLAVLFRPSLATLYLWQLGFTGTTGLLLFVLTGLVAPAALALGFAAAAELDRAPGKSGRPQALLGFLVGLWGMFDWLAEVNSWLEYAGYY